MLWPIGPMFYAIKEHHNQVDGIVRQEVDVPGRPSVEPSSGVRACPTDGSEVISIKIFDVEFFSMVHVWCIFVVEVHSGLVQVLSTAMCNAISCMMEDPSLRHICRCRTIALSM